MRLRIAVACLTILALCSTTANAQNERKQKPGPGRLQSRDGEKQRKSVFDRIRDELDLDEDQLAQYDEIAAKYRKSAHRSKGHVVDNGAGRKEFTRGEGRERNLDEFFDEVEGILHDDQMAAFAKIRESRTAARGPGRGGRVAQLRRLQSDLKLNEDQNKQYDALLADLEEKLRSGGSQDADVAAIIEEIRTAAEQGDTERIKELREQLPDQRAASEQAVAEFLTEVESFLEPGQLETLERYRSTLNANRNEADLRDCFRFVSRLDLDKDQRETVRELQRDSTKSLRDARRDPAETERITKETRTKLHDLLNADQAAEYDRWLQESQKSKRGKRPHARPQRGEKP